MNRIDACITQIQNDKSNKDNAQVSDIVKQIEQMSKEIKDNKSLVNDLHFLSTYQQVAKAEAHQEQKEEEQTKSQIKKKSLLEKVKRQLQFEKQLKEEEEEEQKA